MADENDWAPVLTGLVNDCLGGLLSWEEFEQEVDREAKRLGYKVEPLAEAERNFHARHQTVPG
jgi:hypothetical protein